jgi:diaminopimelate decarboxylase
MVRYAMVGLMPVTHTLIYPHTTAHNAAGHLEVGGCDVVDLAREFGTPLFIYDEQTLRDQCRAYHSAFGTRTDDYEVVYASKAFSCRAMAQLVAQEGLSLDVATGGELAAACAADFPPQHIYFHGNNKSVAEIEAGLDADIGHFVVDSLEEIARLEAAVAKRGGHQQVLVRVTPGVRPNTHDFVQTGQQDSKFGFGLADSRADEAVRLLQDAAHLELVGVHAHIGSQIFELDSYRREVEVLFIAIDKWRQRFDFACRVFNIGGGLGIRYTEADRPSSIAEFAEASVTAVREGAERHDMAVPRLFVEPGRSIAGKAAITAYTVGTVKVIPGVRTYVAVDGGMSDNLRPMLYDSRYEAMLANKATVAPSHVVTVAGKHCESGDVLVRDIHIAPPEPGDILVTPGTGAYGYAMANNYNAQPRPAVELVRGGEAHVIIERETWDDVLRLQRPLAR